MGEEWSNLSFKQFNSDSNQLELEKSLKIQMNRNLGDVLQPLSGAEISKLKSLHGISRSQNKGIRKSHNLAKK